MGPFLSYLFHPHDDAERARGFSGRLNDLRNNGRGPHPGEVAQWNRWNQTRPWHEQGQGAFIPVEFKDWEERMGDGGMSERGSWGGDGSASRSGWSAGYTGYSGSPPRPPRDKSHGRPSAGPRKPVREGSTARSTKATTPPRAPTSPPADGRSTRENRDQGISGKSKHGHEGTGARGSAATTGNTGHWATSQRDWGFAGARRGRG